jgi:hypothetical protein
MIGFVGSGRDVWVCCEGGTEVDYITAPDEMGELEVESVALDFDL